MVTKTIKETKCDFCSASETYDSEKKDFPTGWVTFGVKLVGQVSISSPIHQLKTLSLDLCIECQEDIVNFFKGDKEDGSEESGAENDQGAG